MIIYNNCYTMDVHYLLRQNIIPPLDGQLPANARYPAWYYKLNKKKDISKEFQAFVYRILEKTLKGQVVNYNELWKEEKTNIPLLGIEKWIKLTLGQEEGISCACNYFYTEEWIAFPYISSTPSKERNIILLQACTLCLQARLEGRQALYVGILFPLQKSGLWYDLSAWDSSKFQELSTFSTAWREEAPRLPFKGCYGHHVGKEMVMRKEFTDYDKPTQIFITSPQGRVPVNYKDLEGIKENVKCPLFVHGRYIYNLCSTDVWIVQGIIEEIKAAQFIGARGVVVHVGKSKDNDLEESLSIMESNIKQVLIEVTTCPLILETCAGQGSEVLAHPDEFIEFYNRFDHDKLKICVDSAHCHGAGYNTLYFLRLLEDNKPGSVVLVHFNDSKVALGERKDRHEFPGMGFVGYERMQELHDYCLEKGIPMVHE